VDSVNGRPLRQTADLSEYPDLVVIYLGMRVNSLRGMRTLRQYGPRIRQSAAARPDGLLRHEMVMWGLLPPHLGMRQYWRDFDALERWARSDPHAAWWRDLLADMGGTGF
jgi:Monooxygenase af470-like